MRTPNQSVIERYVQAFNRGDLDGVCDCFTDDAKIWGVLGFGGLEVARPIWKDLMDCLRMNLEIAAIIEEADSVAVRFIERGESVKPFRGFPATGKTYEIVAMEWFEMKDGRIHRRWGARFRVDHEATWLVMMGRYHRQILLPQIGEAGQRRLSASRITLIGCGTLGTVIAEQLVRAGVGHLTVCDRDIVELTNLQRQTLFTESDATKGIPKSLAAASRLRELNASIRIDPQVIDVNSGNIERLIEDASIILDGTDNAQTRYLINDVAVKSNIPWVYGASVGTTGRAMGIVPNQSPCLRCLFPDPPGPGELQTCDTAGVLAPAAAIVASFQVAEAFKIILGDADAARNLITFDLWPLRMRTIDTSNARRAECMTCGERNFAFLDRADASDAVSLCGRNTVQIRPATNRAFIDLEQLAARLASAGGVQTSAFFVRCTFKSPNLTMTLFPDGRALIHGTSDISAARSLYAKYVGS